MKIRNILCDRDGTLIVDKHYLADPSQVELLPSVKEGLCLLYEQDYFLALVSNQSGVGRGFFTHDDVLLCNQALLTLLTPIKFTTMLYCPHAPEETCSCRKPYTGMWHQIQEQYNLTPEHTVMIGDKIDDIGFAIRAGFPFAFLTPTGKGEQLLHDIGIATPSSIYNITQALANTFNINTQQTAIYTAHSFLDIVTYILTLS